MNTECKPEQLEFQSLGRREVIGRFDGGRITSDGGGLLLREVDQRIGLLDRLAACFTDHRNPESIEHSVRDLVAQRVYGLALGYEDLNDHDDLRKDSTLALLVGKRDLTGERRVREQDRGNPLAASSTLNRLELGTPESASSDRYKRIAADNEAMDRLLVDLFLESYRKPPRKIWLDLDATDDPLHGQQEGRFFHGYYRCYCYLPLYIFSGEHLLCARLRTADKDASSGSVDELQRIVGQIRARWPKTRIIIRADSGFCRDAIMAWCETNDVGYVLGLARNKRLQRALGKEMEAARLACERTGEAARCFRDFRYRTRKSWSCERRVIGKAEYLPGKANPRFVVTNLSTRDADAQHLYEDLYCARGEMEKFIGNEFSRKPRRGGEPDQGAATGTVRRSHQQCHPAGEPTAAVLLFFRLCPAAWPASAGADRYGVCQGPEHDDPPETAENRRPSAPDSTQSLAVLLGSVPLRQRYRSDPGQSQAAPCLVTPWINPITSGNVDTTDQTPVLRGRRVCSVEKTSSRAPERAKNTRISSLGEYLGTRNGLSVYLGHVPAPKNAGTREWRHSARSFGHWPFHPAS